MLQPAEITQRPAADDVPPRPGTRRDLPIPQRLNVAIAGLAVACVVACLLVAAHAQPFWLVLPAILGFALVQNTVFSLLHEASHGMLLRDKHANDVLGALLGSLFPLALSFHRRMHLGHHARNRTDAEIFDMYYPEDSRLMKRVQILAILFGPYWASIPLACLAYALAPRLFLAAARQADKLAVIRQTGSEGLVRGLAKAPVMCIRAEVVLALLVQGGLLWAMGGNWLIWLACYWAFGVVWGGLQYADHAFTPRDIRQGAWNLEVNPVIRWLFLNYHDHKVHHSYPWVPWIHLPRFVDKSEHRPRWGAIWWRFLKGPVPVTEPAPGQLAGAFETRLNRPISEDQQ